MGHLSYQERLKAPFIGELAAQLTERLLVIIKKGLSHDDKPF